MIALRPGHAQAHHNRGTMLMDLRRPGEAMVSFDQAIGVVAAHSNRRNVQLELANVEAAIDDFDKAITLQPDYAAVHCNRGNALLALLPLFHNARERGHALAWSGAGVRPTISIAFDRSRWPLASHCATWISIGFAYRRKSARRTKPRGASPKAWRSLGMRSTTSGTRPRWSIWWIS
jgi:tetratricopeptide (TPR) repeat protein